MEHNASNKHNTYLRLIVMMGLSFVAMYILMYSMVDIFANVIPNINQFYMVGLMIIPMLVLELLLMGMMYSDKKLNLSIIIISIILFILLWIGIREQIGVSDKQFLKSMIPHHAGAILMCKQAPIEDSELKQLCADILIGQQNEIDQMKTILNRLKNK